MPTAHTPSVDQLKRALELTAKIEELESELHSVLSGAVNSVSSKSSRSSAPVEQEEEEEQESAPAPRRGRKGKRVVSAEARAKMAAAQRARWARARRNK